jgi:hypothetical protein
VNCQDQYFDVRKASTDLSGRLNAMDPRHRVIEHGNVGLALLCLLDCLFAIARLCYDLPVGLPLDEPAQPGSYDLVVISDKYTYHGNGRLLEHAFDARIYSTGPDCFRTAAKPRKTQYTSEQYFRRELGLIFFAPGWDSVRSSQRLAAVRPPNLLFVVVKAGAHTPRPQGPAQPLRLEPRSGLTKKFRLRCCEPRETFWRWWPSAALMAVRAATRAELEEISRTATRMVINQTENPGVFAGVFFYLEGLGA